LPSIRAAARREGVRRRAAKAAIDELKERIDGAFVRDGR
jgi:hypothetical protein